MDIWDKKKRSEVMSKIRSKDTKPEVILRRALFAKGYRYRVNYKKLPGKPDIVLPKYRTVIFVHGCFWHGHHGCRDSHIPKTNTEYWKAKIGKNKERDKKNIKLITSMGWRVLTIWDCEIRKKHHLQSLIYKLERCLRENVPFQKYLTVKVYDSLGEEVVQVAEDIIPYNTPTQGK